MKNERDGFLHITQGELTVILIGFCFLSFQEKCDDSRRNERAHNLGSEDQHSVSAFMVRAFLS